MNRFAADTPSERRTLFVDAVAAHRERASAFLTVEADVDVSDEDLGSPWIQFGDGTITLDCTDEELDRLKSLLDEFPAFKIEDLHRPEDAEGTHAAVSALADANRIAQCLDRIFRDVFRQPEGYLVWVAAI